MLSSDLYGTAHPPLGKAFWGYYIADAAGSKRFFVQGRSRSSAALGKQGQRLLKFGVFPPGQIDPFFQLPVL